MLTDDIIVFKEEQCLCSLYGLKILVFDELCKKYNTDCLCVDEPTFYAMCKGKEYTKIGKKTSQVLDKLQDKINERL